MSSSSVEENEVNDDGNDNENDSTATQNIKIILTPLDKREQQLKVS
jgi:hypothetical protein